MPSVFLDAIAHYAFQRKYFPKAMTKTFLISIFGRKRNYFRGGKLFQKSGPKASGIHILKLFD